MSRPLLQASLAVWQARALRYSAIYVALACATLGLRFATQETYPQLRELRKSVIELQTQRDHLELEVQTLTTGPRVREWAASQGMVLYAQASKTTADIAPLPAPPAPTPEHARLEVVTKWN